MIIIESEQGGLIYGSDNATDTVWTTVSLVVSSIGVALSAAAIVLLMLTAGLFLEWRKIAKNQLLIQLIIARFQYTFVRYYFDIRNEYKLCGNFQCIMLLDEYTLIFTEVALIGWMSVFSRQMHESLVKVFTDKPKVLRISVLTWTVSAVIALLLYLAFRLLNDNDLKYFFVYLGLLKWPVLVSNMIILVAILKSITKSNKQQLKTRIMNRSYVRMLIVMLTMIFTFGLHQILIDLFRMLNIFFTLPTPFLIVSNIIMIYFCAFSVVFWVFGNARAREMWKTWWRGSRPPSLQQQKSIEDDTYL